MGKIIFFVLLLLAFSAYAAKDSIQIKGRIILNTKVVTNVPERKIETITDYEFPPFTRLALLVPQRHTCGHLQVGYDSLCSIDYNMKIIHTIVRTKKRRGQEKKFYITGIHIIKISPRNPIIPETYFTNENCPGTILKKKKPGEVVKFVYGFKTKYNIHIPLVEKGQRIKSTVVFNLKKEKVNGIDNYFLSCSYE